METFSLLPVLPCLSVPLLTPLSFPYHPERGCFGEGRMMKENKTRCYCQVETVTSHNKPKLHRVSQRQEAARKGCAAHHENTTTPGVALPHATHLSSRLHHVGAKWVLGALEIGGKPVGVECVKRRTVPGEEVQIQAHNGRKGCQSLSLGSVWDSAGPLPP